MDRTCGPVWTGDDVPWNRKTPEPSREAEPGGLSLAGRGSLDVFWRLLCIAHHAALCVRE